jgi:hypothetical protein
MFIYGFYKLGLFVLLHPNLLCNFEPVRVGAGGVP